MDARVEAYIDGDLPDEEHAAFEHMLDEHPRWQEQVRYAQRIRTELRTLPAPSCPPQVTDAVLQETRQRANGGPPASWWARLWNELDIELQIGWKPALAFATVLLIAVVSSLLTPPQNTAGLFDAPMATSQQYSPAEIEAAKAEAEWAIAYIAQVSQRTGTTVETTVLTDNVADPVRRALRPLSSADRDPTVPQR